MQTEPQNKEEYKYMAEVLALLKYEHKTPFLPVPKFEMIFVCLKEGKTAEDTAQAFIDNKWFK